MKCVIVGGGGFVGRHLGNLHASRGDAVHAFDAGLVAAGTNASFPIEPLDVLEAAPKIPDGCDVVYYLAQSPHYRDFPAHADHLFGVNVVGALRTAEAARRAGARRFVYASTGNVYAPSFAPLRESDAVRRDDAYGLSKLAGEEALSLVPSAGDGPEVLRVRLFGVYGPGQRSGLVPAIVERVRDGAPVTLAAHPTDAADDGGLRISLTFVDDVTAMLADLVALPGPLPGVLNLAAPEAVSIRALGESIGRLLEKPVAFEPAAPRETDYVADVSLLQDLVPMRHTPLSDAVDRTLPACVRAS